MEIKCEFEELDNENINNSNIGDNEQLCKVEHIDTAVLLEESRQKTRSTRVLKRKYYDESEPVNQVEFYVNEDNDQKVKIKINGVKNKSAKTNVKVWVKIWINNFSVGFRN